MEGLGPRPDRKVNPEAYIEWLGDVLRMVKREACNDQRVHDLADLALEGTEPWGWNVWRPANEEAK